jgi:hypothetical protein
MFASYPGGLWFEFRSEAGYCDFISTVASFPQGKSRIIRIIINAVIGHFFNDCAWVLCAREV